MKKLSENLTRKRKTLFVVWLILVCLIAINIKPVSINASINETSLNDNEYQKALVLMDSIFGRQADIAIKVIPEESDFSSLKKGYKSLRNSIKKNFAGSVIISPIETLKSIVDEKQSSEIILKQAASIPLLQDLISKDSSSFLVLVRLTKNYKADPVKFNSILSTKYSGIKSLKSFSIIELESQIETSLRRDLAVLSLSIFILFIIILIYAYRSWQSLFFCLSIAAPSILFAIWCFSFFDVELNLITLVVIPITIVLALADAVHLLTGYHSNKNETLSINSRISNTIQSYIYPSFLTSFTTAIAFYSFVLNDAENLQNLGLITGTAVFGGFFLTYLLGPILLPIIPLKNLGNHPFSKLSRHFSKQKKTYSIFIILLFVISIFCTTSMEFKSSFTNFFPKDSKVLKSHNELEKDFYSQIKLNLLIQRKDEEKTSKIELQEEVQRIFNSIPSFQHVGKANYKIRPKKSGLLLYPPLLNITSQFINSTDFVSKDENTHRIEIRFFSPNHIKLFEREFLKRFKDQNQDLKISFASPALVLEAVDKSTASSLLKSLSLSTLIIVVVIGFLTKSILKTIYSLVANMAPLSAILLLFWIFDLKINVLTAITSVVCLGLIVDDTLHVVYRKVRLKDNLEELGFGMILTSIIVTGGFLLFNLSSFTPTQTFGNISSVIFIITLISDLTLLPLLLHTKKQK